MKLFRGPLVGVAAGALVLGIFAGCEAGGTSVADGGIRGTGSSVGPVSGFGSVFVNGVEFFTNSILNRKVEGNDGIENEADLHEGMILRINGNWQKNGTGKAESMEYDDSLRGTVSEVTSIAAEKRLSFKIHGQPVFADLQTVFKGKSFAALADGDFVRVSAWRQADGNYRASYVGVAPTHYGDDPIEVEGPVDERSLTDTGFTMKSLAINFSGAQFTGGLSADDLEQGTYYEVEGELIGGVLQASRIQPDDFRRYQKSGDDIELAGPVSSGYNSSSQSFGLNGLTIKVTNKTELDELTVDDLSAGLLVQVEGEFVSPTVIRATEIEVREGDVELEGSIDAGSITDNGFSVGGARIRVTTSQTIITDDDSDERLTMNDLNPALVASKFILVEISGLAKKNEFGDTYIDALQIERELSDNDDSEYKIEGKLEGISGDDIRVLGVLIRTTDDVLDKTTLADFADRLRNGDETIILEVEYKKKRVGTASYIATSVEEDD